MKGDYAIIPVREFASAKVRLKKALTSEKRVALASSLLRRLVGAIERSQLEGVIIVASDISEAISCLEGYKRISVICENSYHGGVNRAMTTGIDFARGKGARTFSLFPSDLPLVTHSRIDDALELFRRYELIINPSLKKDGTNLLAFKSSVKFELHYDDDSFVKHSDEARRGCFDFITLDWKEFLVDLDDVDDLEMAMKYYETRSFHEFLDRISRSEV